MYPYMSDRQNLNWKMRSRVKVIVFGTSLYRFTVYPDCIICIPWQTACGKPFYTSTSTPLQRLKHVWLPSAFFCSAPTVWYGMIPVNATANHSCTILSQTQKQVWIQLLEEVWMSSHSDMLHAFHSFPSFWVANHHHGPMLLPWLSSSRRKIAKPDLQVQVCRCARDEPGLTKAMGRRKRICIAAKRSQ